MKTRETKWLNKNIIRLFDPTSWTSWTKKLYMFEFAVVPTLNLSHQHLQKISQKKPSVDCRFGRFWLFGSFGHGFFSPETGHEDNPNEVHLEASQSWRRTVALRYLYIYIHIQYSEVLFNFAYKKWPKLWTKSPWNGEEFQILWLDTTRMGTKLQVQTCETTLLCPFLNIQNGKQLHGYGKKITTEIIKKKCISHVQYIPCLFAKWSSKIDDFFAPTLRFSPRPVSPGDSKSFALRANGNIFLLGPRRELQT